MRVVRLTPHYQALPIRQLLNATSMCSQLSQRVTCPPSAAVRQRSMADMTFSVRCSSGLIRAI